MTDLVFFYVIMIQSSVMMIMRVAGEKSFIELLHDRIKLLWRIEGSWYTFYGSILLQQ